MTDKAFGVPEQGLIDAVRAVMHYQSNPHVHPLTCGNNSEHQVLQPMIVGTQVALICIDCGYVQTYIPDYIFPKRFASESEINEMYRIVRNALNDWAGGVAVKDQSYIALNILYQLALEGSKNE